MGRLQVAEQLNGPLSEYHYDEAGHLLEILHTDGSSNTLAHFEYEVDARGNRIAVTETLAQPSSGNLVLEIAYDYDALARLIEADYTIGMDTRLHEFTYDLAGNRTQEVVTLNSTPTTTNYSYDEANRLDQIGGQTPTYDDAGRLTYDGTLTYTWDRASRLLSAGGSSYLYNGLGQRVEQTVSSVVTEYLLDVQPGLWQVLTATTSSNVTRYVHGPWGLHLQQQPNTDWRFPLHDGLNSLRSIVDEALDPLHIQNFAPYGSSFGAQGSAQSSFGFTGEPTDQNALVQLRARYYNPELRVFPSLDPLEGDMGQSTSLNRYGYVQNNPTNWVDPSGLTTCNQPTPHDRLACFNPFNPLESIRVEQARRALEPYGVKLTVENPAPDCSGGNSQIGECLPGCWTARNAETVLESVRIQAARISGVGGNFRNFLPPNGIPVVMSGYDNPLGYAALTPAPYSTGDGQYLWGPARIIIWTNGQEPWSDKKIIFSPELVTHEFGHALSLEWLRRERLFRVHYAPTGFSEHLLSYRFNSNYYGNFELATSLGQPDFITTTEGTTIYLWQGFASGSPSAIDRAKGRFYNDRFTPEELFAEAYAVWIHNHYASGLAIDQTTGLTVDELVSVQRRFFERVFSGQYTPGGEILRFL